MDGVSSGDAHKIVLPRSLDECITYLQTERDAQFSDADIGMAYFHCVASMGRTRYVFPISRWSVSDSDEEWARARTVQNRKHKFQEYTFAYFHRLVLCHWVDKYDHDQLLAAYQKIPELPFSSASLIQQPRRATIESALYSIVESCTSDHATLTRMVGTCVKDAAREWGQLMIDAKESGSEDWYLCHEYDTITQKLQELTNRECAE